MQSRILGGVCAAFAVLALTLALQPDARAGGKSDSKVKASAKASKVSADGKQTLTITLEIEKGWHIYANPVGDEDFEGNKTRVNVKAKNPVKLSVAYPPGKTQAEGKVTLKIYEGKVTIQAAVVRTAGDSSPLQVNIDVNACNKGTCLLPGTVKLQVP